MDPALKTAKYDCSLIFGFLLVFLSNHQAWGTLRKKHKTKRGTQSADGAGDAFPQLRREMRSGAEAALAAANGDIAPAPRPGTAASTKMLVR